MAYSSSAFTRMGKNPGSGQVFVVQGLLDQALIFSGPLWVRAINGA
jgi:hypothetical protein